MAHSSGPLRRRRARRFHTSRSTRAFSVLGTAGMFAFMQWSLFTSTPRDGFWTCLVAAAPGGALLWFIWRCGASAGINLGSRKLRVEQLFHSRVLTPDRVRAVRDERGLAIRTPARTIGVFGLSGSLIADWTGNTSVRRAGAAVREWVETTPVSGDGGVERVSVRRALLTLVAAEVVAVGTYALGQLAVAVGWL
ncbi:hypothetical protein [Quadrisphaera granulorum]|uniref:hypothetical protein n=1 Tax=Quadrisphaera granulorum TaxID=317664 RepID=UPI000D6C92E1|nr:hypothetical protein [Quadrisphaera granulorum]